MFARCYHYGVSRETLLSPLPGKARLTVWRSPMRRVRMMLSLRCQSGNPPATSTGQSPSDNLTQSYAHFVRFSHTIRNLIITRLWILIISPPSQASALIFPLFLFFMIFFLWACPYGSGYPLQSEYRFPLLSLTRCALSTLSVFFQYNILKIVKNNNKP